MGSAIYCSPRDNEHGALTKRPWPTFSRKKDLRKPLKKHSSGSGGILKRRAAKPPAAKRRWFWQRCLRPKSLVSFAPSVKVTEFARKVGGCTVPYDGSSLSLGLGKRMRVKSLPLAASSPYSDPIEERAWVPMSLRIQYLRKAMGDAGYWRASAKNKRETQEIQRSRESCNSVPVDQQLMPTSWEEARRRALDLEREVQEKPAPSTPVSPKARLSRQSRRRSFGADLSNRSPSPQRKLRRCLLSPEELGAAGA